MRLKKVIGFMLIMLIVLPTIAFASGSDDDTDIEIKSGEVINENLTLYENASIEAGAIINGDVAVFVGTLEMDGTINGDLTVFGGDVELTGAVNGDIAVIGGDLEIESLASISGECVLVGGEIEGSNSCFNPITQEIDLNMLNDIVSLGDFNGPIISDGGSLGLQDGSLLFPAALSMLFTAMIVGAAAYFVTSAVPNRMYEVRSAVKHNPMAAGGIGALTAIAGSSLLILTSPIWASLLIVLSFVCGLGIFLGFAGAFYLGAVVMFGWIAVGSLTAGRMFGRSNRFNANEPLTAGIGTAIVTFLFGMLSVPLPGVAFFLASILFCIGLGGVVLTKLGRQSYPVRPQMMMDENSIKINRVMSTLPPE